MPSLRELDSAARIEPTFLMAVGISIIPRNGVVLLPGLNNTLLMVPLTRMRSPTFNSSVTFPYRNINKREITKEAYILTNANVTRE